MQITISKEVLNGLRSNQIYAQKVLPYLFEEYFEITSESKIFFIIKDYIQKYQSLPSKNAVIIELDLQKIPQTLYEESLSLIKEVYSSEKIEDKDVDFLIKKTEKFCKNQSIHNALIESINIVEKLKEENDDDFSESNIPELFTKAISVSFNDSVGHEFFDDAEERFEYYHNKETKIPFGLDILNSITNGGVPKKTLNIIMAGVGTGKSLMMCDFAANNLRDGKNVLYITLEMSEFEISKRIDANLMNVSLLDIETLSKEQFMSNIDKIKQKTYGKLYVKQYPTGVGSVTHFNKLVEDLKLKKGFIPDVVYVDYINICASSKGKLAGIVGSYGFMKTVAEEVRGFMVNHDFCGWTATQSNRSGVSSSDPEITNASESMGIPNISDLFLAVVSNDELAQEGKYMVKQLKNRYENKTLNTKFFVGVSYEKMKLYDIAGEENYSPVFEKNNDYTDDYEDEEMSMRKSNYLFNGETLQNKLDKMKTDLLKF
jgi:replicative DNA helicase